MGKKTETDKAPEIDPVDKAAEVEIAGMKPAQAPKGISEEEITEKVRVGLTRDQAIEVIENQRKHDAAQAKSK